ncbi:YkoF-like protein [Cercophora scortea]|uniref:YkoF-like protein n=1 Tax=Cercophora scortea TaxID=314031 RepID=A0AAE0IZL3_9PEZI|nr:YkoF-like protein [Cercophora scortea]
MYANIKTPATCYVDFCLIPIGTHNVSVAQEVADVQRLLKDSGLFYTMHSAGTTVEGSWDEVMKVVGQAHSVVHQGGVKRVQTSMRVGTRTDKSQTAADKVKRIEDILSQDTVHHHHEHDNDDEDNKTQDGKNEFSDSDDDSDGGGRSDRDNGNNNNHNNNSNNNNRNTNSNDNGSRGSNKGSKRSQSPTPDVIDKGFSNGYSEF